MTDVASWMQHRMSVLEIAGPAALAEQADLAEETVARILESSEFTSLQQSQRRRLAWALQVNLKKLNALADGQIEWIEDADRYLPFSFDPAGDEDRRPRIEPAPAAAPLGAFEAPQGTPVLGRVGIDGRVESDDCWDEQWGRRLPDGQPQRRDTYALESQRDFLVVRNAKPWEARAGAMVAVYLCDGAGDAAWFGKLARCTPGNWALLPGLAGGSDGGLMTIDPEQVLRIGRLLRTWPDGPEAAIATE